MLTTEKDYCDKDLSLALKEAGYIGQGRCYYDLDKEPNKLRHFGIQVLTTRSAEALNFVLAVHLYEAQKWLREEKKIEVNATYDNVVELHWHWYMKSLTNRNQTTSIINYDSYEQALLAGIKVAVKILKEDEAIHG